MNRLLSMNRAVTAALTSVLLALALTGASSAPMMSTAVTAQSAGSGTCGLSQVAFCETFDQPAGTGNRSGQLNGTLWGVSRTTGYTNLGAGLYDAWSPVELQTCSGTSMVQPDNDIIICNGQAREATYDNGTVTSLTMYPKQPFDFAGRTGIATFDVSNDTQGTHAAWPEFWMTDQPVPAPFTHESTWVAAPRNGFGVRFAASVGPEKGALLAPGCPNDANTRWTVDSGVIIRNYVVDDSFNGGAMKVTPLDCVIASGGPNGLLNHVEVHVAQNQIDVYATDAGTIAPLHHIAVIENANLTLTRGVIWIEHSHYNAGKFNNQRAHTFTWDNVGFDGPVLARDLTFDVPDAVSAGPDGTVNLGWLQKPNEAQAKTIPAVSNISNATAAMLMFNFFDYTAPNAFTYVVNGVSHTAVWPYPDKLAYTWRTLALPVPLADVLTGTNTVSVTSDQAMIVANVDLLLVGAGDGTSAIPGALSQPTTLPPTQTPEAVSQPVTDARPPLTTLAQAPVDTNGGNLAVNQISLRVPAGVVGPGGGDLSLLPLDPQSVPALTASDELADVAVAITLTDSTTGTQISAPSSALALRYGLSPAEISQADGDATRFAVVTWSGDQWVPLTCATDGTTLDCVVPQLGLFAVVITPAT